MRGLLYFLFGFGCGAGATLLWLHKDIKNALENIKTREEASTEPDLPFVVEQGTDTTEDQNAHREPLSASEGHSAVSNATSTENREKYRTLVRDTMTNPEKLFQDTTLQIPISPRDDEPEETNKDEDEAEAEDEGHVINDIPEGVFEIDLNTYKYDNANEKERLVYFQGDHILATENGTIIRNPAMLIGTNWEEWVGHYLAHTALIRNPKLVTDYEVYVEGGTYAEEYGDEFDISDLG